MNLRIIIMVFFPIFAIAQAPQKINFQSILRNGSGEVVGNKSVSLKISILSGSINGSSNGLPRVFEIKLDMFSYNS